MELTAAGEEGKRTSWNLRQQVRRGADLGEGGEVLEVKGRGGGQAGQTYPEGFVRLLQRGCETGLQLVPSTAVRIPLPRPLTPV